MNTDNRYSIDEILEEQRRAKEESARAAEDAGEEALGEDAPLTEPGDGPAAEEFPGEDEPDGATREYDVPDADGDDPEEDGADGEYPEDDYGDEGDYPPEEDYPEEDYPEEDYPEEDYADEADADGAYPEEDYAEDEPEENPREAKRRRRAEEKAAKREEKQRRKAQKKGFFARRREKKQAEDFDAAEDMYYGIQLKPIDEYTRGFATGEVALGEEGFKKLFDENTKELDDEVAANFDRLQRERRRRVAEAVENVGGDVEKIDREFGIVAPPPVSAFAADPYARQHGIEGAESDLPEFQKAMLQDAETHTMEFKLDVTNDSLDVQQTKVMPEVSEDSVRRILETVDPSLEGVEKEPPKLVTLAEEEKPEEAAAPETEEAAKEAPETAPEEAAEETAAEDAGAPEAETPEAGEAAGETEEQTEPAAAEEAPGEEPAPMSLPVSDVTQYRPRDLTMHVVNADVLQSALLSEAKAYSDREAAEAAQRERFRAKQDGRLDDAFYSEDDGDEEQETLDDYTGPADAKSVSHDLRVNLNAVTLRVLVTGIGTLALFIVTLFSESRFSEAAQPGDAVGYIVTSLILLLIVLGFCWNTIAGGLRSLMSFRPNSDSAAAVAAVAVLADTVCAFFFEGELAVGQVHLFPAVAAGLLFFNALGKLTLLRRVYSNFRFVASREPKHAVRIFDDHNTSLRLVGASSPRPVIAYQQKADFLKRFLQISYAPDDAEAASQAMAPWTLIASLALCAGSLIVTGDVGISLTVLAASACVTVCAANLLAINLPISRLSRALRRAGAMVSGFEAVRRVSETNTVFVDSEQLFPRGSIVLNGIKAFRSEGLEDAVLSASVLVHELGGPIGGVFDQVLQEFENTDLPRVGSTTYETGSGVVGRVGARTVLIGNRRLLTAHGVEPPEESLEKKFLAGGRQILYLAMDGDLYALFSVTYNADAHRRAELRAAQENGITLLVRAADPNLTPEFLAGLFRLDVQSLRVIGAGEERAMDEMALGTAGRVDAYAATKGRLESMLRLITGSMDMKNQVAIIVALQTVSVVLGFVIAALMTFLSGVGRLSTATLFLYEAFWIVVMLFLPKFIARQTRRGDGDGEK